MDKSTLSVLQRTAHINNVCKQAAKKEVFNLLPQLSKFIDKKVFTGKNTRTKIFNPSFLEFVPESFNNGCILIQHIYLQNIRNSLTLCLSYCFNGGKYEDRTYYCQYERLDIEIGAIDSEGKLFEVLPEERIIKFNCLDDIINIDEELKKITTFLEAEKAAKELKKSIKFNYDLYKYLI